jgi:hypothetical protein
VTTRDNTAQETRIMREKNKERKWEMLSEFKTTPSSMSRKVDLNNIYGNLHYKVRSESVAGSDGEKCGDPESGGSRTYSTEKIVTKLC